MIKSPLVSICILSWNTRSETTACLESVRALDYDAKEIIIVDNGSTDGSKEFLASQGDIIYVDLPHNTGFTGGQLAALDKVSGDYILLVNSDAVADPQWLARAVPIMEQEAKIGALGGRAYTWLEGQEPYDTASSFYSYQVIDTHTGYGRTCMAGDVQMEVDSISGAGVLLRKSAIDTVGYFDNSFFAYFEETDLFARMQRAGYTIVYEPTLHMWHKIAQSTKGKPYFYLYHMHRNRFMYALKNFDTAEARSFFWFYCKDGLVALARYLRHHDLDSRARVNSLGWNLAHLATTLSARRQVQALGGNYSKKLTSHHIPSDITVIIPCYNYEDHVGEAIESVLNQTLPASRIIVIDDGSTDESVRVIKRYEKQGIELIAKRNEGVVATKNLGIAMATTDWVVFLDADDFIEPDYLEKLYKRAVHTKCDVVYTDMIYFGAREGVVKGGRFNFKRLLAGNFIHNSALISTSFLKQVGGYKPAMNGGYEDWELYITLAENGARFSYIPKALLHYRQHSAASSRNEAATAKAKELWNTVHELHANTYRKFNGITYKLRRGFQEVAKNPLLIFLAILITPWALLYGLRSFALGFKAKMLHILRNYAERKHTDDSDEIADSLDSPKP